MSTTTNKNTSKKSGNTPKPEWAPGLPFQKTNYILMIIGVVVLFIGYLLLSGGKSEDSVTFSEAIFNTRRLVVAPITLVIGFLIELFAIMYRPKGGKAQEENEQSTPQA